MIVLAEVVRGLRRVTREGAGLVEGLVKLLFVVALETGPPPEVALKTRLAAKVASQSTF